jgi:hypothetical protein
MPMCFKEQLWGKERIELNKYYTASGTAFQKIVHDYNKSIKYLGIGMTIKNRLILKNQCKMPVRHGKIKVT